MKLEKVSIQDVLPSKDGNLKLILIDRDGNKSINYYPKSYENIYLNDMYFFMNQGYIVLDNDCIPVNPIILTDDMIGKQVQLLNGQIHTVYRGMHDSHYTIGKHLYDCFGHGRPMPTASDFIPLTYHVLGPAELKYDPLIRSAFKISSNLPSYTSYNRINSNARINSNTGYTDYLEDNL